MASAPSASALSAVLRCRGNIWSRSPPAKRPSGSVRGLGLAGGLRDTSAERAASPRESSWGAFLQGQPIVLAGRLTVAYTGGKAQGEKDFREQSQLCHPRLSQSSGHARSAAPNRVQNALLRQLARRLTCNLPGTDCCSHMIHMITCQTYAANICRAVCVQDAREVPAGAFKVSIKSPCVREDGWSTLSSTCLSLTAVVSGLMCLRLAVLCRSGSGPDKAPKHLLRHQDERQTEDGLQADGHRSTGLTSNKDNFCSGQKLTEDRPD